MQSKEENDVASGGVSIAAPIKSAALTAVTATRVTPVSTLQLVSASPGRGGTTARGRGAAGRARAGSVFGYLSGRGGGSTYTPNGTTRTITIPASANTLEHGGGRIRRAQ